MSLSNNDKTSNPSNVKNGEVYSKRKNGGVSSSRPSGDASKYSSPPSPSLPPGVKPLFGFDPPPPMQWRVDSLVPEDHLTMLIGDGGTGKSFLALHLALCVALGRPFLGFEVQRGRVLYLDYELNAEEQKRRTIKVADGMGFSVKDEALRNHIYYYSPECPLGSKDHDREVGTKIDEMEIDFIVLDSLTMGAMGDMKDQSDFIPIAQELRKWPTTLAIDHVSHSTAQQGSRDARAFGTVFKRNTARSSLTLGKKGEGCILQQEKSNFNEGNTATYYVANFENGKVTFEPTDTSDSRVDGLLGELSAAELTLTAIKRLYNDEAEPIEPEEVVEWRKAQEAKEVTAGTVRNHYTIKSRTLCNWRSARMQG